MKKSEISRLSTHSRFLEKLALKTLSNMIAMGPYGNLRKGNKITTSFRGLLQRVHLTCSCSSLFRTSLI